MSEDVLASSQKVGRVGENCIDTLYRRSSDTFKMNGLVFEIPIICIRPAILLIPNIKQYLEFKVIHFVHNTFKQSETAEN